MSTCARSKHSVEDCPHSWITTEMIAFLRGEINRIVEERKNAAQ